MLAREGHEVAYVVPELVNPAHRVDGVRPAVEPVPLTPLGTEVLEGEPGSAAVVEALCVGAEDENLVRLQLSNHRSHPVHAGRRSERSAIIYPVGKSRSNLTEGTRRPRWVQDYLSEERPPDQPARTVYFITAVVLFTMGALAFFLVLNNVLEQQGLALADEPVRAWMVEHRTETWTTVMIVIAEISGPIGMPIVVFVIIALWVWRSGHAWRVLVLALAMITGMTLALSIARLVGRSRPPEEFMVMGVDPSFSFPSEHVLGVADFLLVAGYLVCSRGRGWVAAMLCAVAAIVGVGLVALTRLYLGYHWLTDVAASVSLSLCVSGWRSRSMPGARCRWNSRRPPSPLSSGTDRV